MCIFSFRWICDFWTVNFSSQWSPEINAQTLEVWGWWILSKHCIGCSSQAATKIHSWAAGWACCQVWSSFIHGFISSFCVVGLLANWLDLLRIIGHHANYDYVLILGVLRECALKLLTKTAILLMILCSTVVMATLGTEYFMFETPHPLLLLRPFP